MSRNKDYPSGKITVLKTEITRWEIETTGLEYRQLRSRVLITKLVTKPPASSFGVGVEHDECWKSIKPTVPLYESGWKKFLKLMGGMPGLLSSTELTR